MISRIVRESSNVVRDAVRAYKQRNRWDNCIVIHKGSLTRRLPSAFVLPLFCGHAKNSLRNSSKITPVLLHNYKGEQIAGKSLRYVGIDNYKTVRVDPATPWRWTFKLTELKKFLDSGGCKTEFIMYIDSDDVVFREDPAKAIQYLEEEDCDMLVSSTSFAGGYDCMPDVKTWTDQIAGDLGYSPRYLNAGVYVARTSFLREVLESALKYVADDEFTPQEYRQHSHKGTICEKLPLFPKGCGDDQVILRYLHPQFYPRMKIDYKARIAQYRHL